MTTSIISMFLMKLEQQVKGAVKVNRFHSLLGSEFITLRTLDLPLERRLEMKQIKIPRSKGSFVNPSKKKEITEESFCLSDSFAV